jgi:hypothetical protein
MRLVGFIIGSLFLARGLHAAVVDGDWRTLIGSPFCIALIAYGLGGQKLLRRVTPRFAERTINDASQESGKRRAP